MKKLFYLLFISSVLASCTKDEPVEADEPIQVVCTCDGATNGTSSSSSSLIDTNLTGHWKQNNVNNPYYPNGYWNDGQIDLHFFANGTWHIDGMSGNGLLLQSEGNYVIHSNNCIDFGSKVFNYSINNGVLTFSSVPGQDYIWVHRYYVPTNGEVYLYIPTNDLSDWNQFAEINNLVKQ